MHDEVLTPKQKKLLPLIGSFFPQFGLVGGTAVALLFGHRKSIDFDLFTNKDFDSNRIRDVIKKKNRITKIYVEKPAEFTLIIDSVKTTFYKYPFDIKYSESFNNLVRLPDLITLAAMKAFALGKRAKWKDYVDLYFIFRKLSPGKIATKARVLFTGEFNEKLFREQLSYFKDIDYSEEIEYMPGFETSDEEIKRFLSDVSLQKD